MKLDWASSLQQRHSLQGEWDIWSIHITDSSCEATFCYLWQIVAPGMKSATAEQSATIGLF